MNVELCILKYNNFTFNTENKSFKLTLKQVKAFLIEKNAIKLEFYFSYRHFISQKYLCRQNMVTSVQL